MLVTLNGRPVLSGKLCFPLAGAWHFTGSVDADVAPSGQAAIAGPGLALTGTIVFARVFRGTLSLRVVGGAGKLASNVDAVPYRFAPIRTIVADLAREAGEAISASSDAPILDVELPAWDRAAGPFSSALWMILRPQGAVFRVLDNGQIWIGSNTWPASPMDGKETIVSADESQSLVKGTIDSCDLRPGTTLGGRRVAYVEYTFAPASMRFEAELGADDGVEFDRGRSAFEMLVRQVMRRTVFHYPHTAQVVGQRVDKSLDVLVEDGLIPGTTNVPAAFGVPDTQATIAAGARCLLEHANADPSRPIITKWLSASVDELDLVSGGTPQVVVRDGDVVSLTGPVSGLAQISVVSAHPPVPPLPPPLDTLIAPPSKVRAG